MLYGFFFSHNISPILWCFPAEIGDFEESQCRSHLLNNSYIPDQMPLIDKIMEFHSKNMWVSAAGDLWANIKKSAFLFSALKTTEAIPLNHLCCSPVNRKSCPRLYTCPTGEVLLCRWHIQESRPWMNGVFLQNTLTRGSFSGKTQQWTLSLIYTVTHAHVVRKTQFFPLQWLTWSLTLQPPSPET